MFAPSEPLFDAIEAEQTAEEIIESGAACVLNLCSLHRNCVSCTSQMPFLDEDTFLVNSLMRIHSPDAMDIDSEPELWSGDEDSSTPAEDSFMDYDIEEPETLYNSWRIGVDEDLSESEACATPDEAETLTALESEVSGLYAACSLFDMSKSRQC